jgi:hypothetical protein
MTDNAWDTSATNPCASCSLTARSSIYAPSPTAPRPTARSAVPPDLAREWAYGLAYRSHHHRNKALPHWLDHYNTRRPAGSATSHPSAAFTTYVGETARYTTSKGSANDT